MDRKIKYIAALTVLSSPCILIAIWGHIEIYFESYYASRKGISMLAIKAIPIAFMSATTAAVIVTPFFVANFTILEMITFLSVINAVFFFFLDSAHTTLSFYFMIFIEVLVQTIILNVTSIMSVDIRSSVKKWINNSFDLMRVMIIIVLTYMVKYVVNPINKDITSSGAFDYEIGSRISYVLVIVSVYCLAVSAIGYKLLKDFEIVKKSKSSVVSISISDSVGSCLGNQNNNAIKAIELEEFFINKNDPSKLFINETNKRLHRSSKVISIDSNNELIKELIRVDEEDDIKPNNNLLVPKNKPPSLTKINLYALNEKRKDDNNDFTIISPKFKVLRTKTFTDSIKGPELTYTAPKTNTKFLFTEFNNTETKSEFEYYDNDIDEEADKYLTEYQLVNKYVFRTSFYIAYISSIVRNSFGLFFMNNFKNIALNYVDDHSISDLNTFSFISVMITQIYAESLLRKYGFLYVTLLVYTLNTAVICIFSLNTDSILIYGLSLLTFRLAFGLNLFLNNKILHAFYPRIIANRLYKYYSTSNIVAAILAVSSSFILASDNNYTSLWLFHIFVIASTAIFLIKKSNYRVK